jgi:hypothetical protein
MQLMISAERKAEDPFYGKDKYFNAGKYGKAIIEIVADLIHARTLGTRPSSVN